MDPILLVSRDELLEVQMELKRLQHMQSAHHDRIRSLEKRQFGEAAVRSAWNSAFPSAIGGTPQHGPVRMPSNDLLEKLTEDQNKILGGLSLDAGDEPARRGAASRANSVRFDESALHGANPGGHSARHSGDFGVSRPGSSFGGHQMERTHSQKSDGRHSSAGQSNYSLYSGTSGRIGHLTLDHASAVNGQGADSTLSLAGPPPGLHTLDILDPLPTIIRCWLHDDFTNAALLYGVVCTGSHKSTVEYSLLRDLDLTNNIHRDVDGTYRVTLPVYFAEGTVMPPNSPTTGVPPNITASFEVTGMDQQESRDSSKRIRIFIGSYTLRHHHADILLTRNMMTLYGTDNNKVSVPFARPEDDAVFKNITTGNLVSSKRRLNAAAPVFVASGGSANGSSQGAKEGGTSGSDGMPSPTAPSSRPAETATTSAASESGAESEDPSGGAPGPTLTKLPESTEAKRRDSNSAIHTPWRHAATALGDNTAPLSGYQQPAPRAKAMMVLKSKSHNSTTRTAASYEPAPASRPTAEQRRKPATEGGRWQKRSVSASALVSLGERTPPAGGAGKAPLAARSGNNPLGSASAFAWTTPKPKAPNGTE
ncbi:hypothetical protein F5144DRAFT_546674 [Chaetomium tenue]|uniref:Uncharacterized protein n=1 Tax=Chaetomium tenue TaxID=1854479 RepID=A0ACB7PE41_9PEZI|nr:hypothetical protein F5144DRAFT_546674 [Chaetomium globosum]